MARKRGFQICFCFSSEKGGRKQGREGGKQKKWIKREERGREEREGEGRGGGKARNEKHAVASILPL